METNSELTITNVDGIFPQTSDRFHYNEYFEENNISPLTKIVSPKVKFYFQKDFPLKDIPKKFYIADFERDISKRHMNAMLASIVTNTFFDNVIRVVLRADGKYDVIDGQHRLGALWRAHKIFGLEKYDLCIQVFDAEFAREIYIKLNIGKRLVTGDHTKALDDGTIPFFNSLRHALLHKSTPSKYSFTGIINALWYAKSGNMDAVRVEYLEKIVNQITKNDINFAMEFVEAMEFLSPVVSHSQYYRVVFLRNLFKVSYDNELTAKKIIPLGEKSMQSRVVKSCLLLRGQEQVNKIYEEIKRIARDV